MILCIHLKSTNQITAVILGSSVFIINISREVLAITQLTKCLQTIVLTFVVIAIVFKDRKMFFSKDHLIMKTLRYSNSGEILSILDKIAIISV